MAFDRNARKTVQIWKAPLDLSGDVLKHIVKSGRRCGTVKLLPR
jgi:hypothetical protein